MFENISSTKSVNSFALIYSISEYLLTTYYMPFTIPGARNIAVIKTHKFLFSGSCHFSRRDKSQTCFSGGLSAIKKKNQSRVRD